MELRQHFRDWKAFVELFIGGGRRDRLLTKIISILLYASQWVFFEFSQVLFLLRDNCVSVIFVIAVSYSNDNLGFLNNLLLDVSITRRRVLNCIRKC